MSPHLLFLFFFSFFFFNDTATTEIYTLSLHDALPICASPSSSQSTPGIVTLSTAWSIPTSRSEEHTSELQSHSDLVCRLLLEKKKKKNKNTTEKKLDPDISAYRNTIRMIRT